jgi:hypothetical protein
MSCRIYNPYMLSHSFLPVTRSSMSISADGSCESIDMARSLFENAFGVHGSRSQTVIMCGTPRFAFWRCGCLGSVFAFGTGPCGLCPWPAAPLGAPANHQTSSCPSRQPNSCCTAPSPLHAPSRPRPQLASRWPAAATARSSTRRRFCRTSSGTCA